MIKKYDKLVRDSIPEVLKRKGIDFKIRTVSGDEYIEMLLKKLSEEVSEFSADQNIEEMADILEVIKAIIKAKDFKESALENLRIKKAEERGGFEKGVVLIQTEEK